MERKLTTAVSVSVSEDGYSSINGGGRTNCSHYRGYAEVSPPSKKKADTLVSKEPQVPPQRSLELARKKSFQAASKSSCLRESRQLVASARLVSKPEVNHCLPTEEGFYRDKMELLLSRALGPKWSQWLEYNMMFQLLKDLVDELRKPKFQCELQKILLRSRKCRPNSAESKQIAVERCAFSQSISHMVMAKSDITWTTNVWEVIAPYVHDERVLVSLANVDELLAFPPHTTLKALLENAKSTSNSTAKTSSATPVNMSLTSFV